MKAIIDHVEKEYKENLLNHRSVVLEETEKSAKTFWGVIVFAVIVNFLAWLVFGGDLISCLISSGIVLSLAWLFIPVMIKVSVNKMIKKYRKAINTPNDQ